MKMLFSLVLISVMLSASVSAQITIGRDSLASENKPLKPYSPSTGTIVGEALVGPVSGAVIGGAAALLFSAISDQSRNGDRGDNLGMGILGAGAGYIFGTSLGVYLFATHDNPEVTLGGTFLGSVLGTGVGVGAAALINDGRSSVPYIIALSCPLIGSMAYANFIAPHPDAVTYSSNMEYGRNVALSYSHKDLYNSTLQYKMNLFTIAF